VSGAHTYSGEDLFISAGHPSSAHSVPDFVRVASATAVVTGVSHFVITASAGAGGSISPSGSISVLQGEDQSFTFTPSSGYGIWKTTIDGVDGLTFGYTFHNVQADHTISVTFGPTITATAGAGGTITPGGKITYQSGFNKTYYIKANTGYHVANVLVDSVSVGAVGSYTFTNITAPHTISVTFAANP
jgi:hypothetical protein